MHIVAPYDVVGIVELHESRVVGVAGGVWLSVFIDPFYRVGPDLPFQGVFAFSGKQRCPAVFLVGPEDADEFTVAGQNGAIEYACGFGYRIPIEYRIAAVSPYYIDTVFRFIFPRHIR